jgi:hypothetical protein
MLARPNEQYRSILFDEPDMHHSEITDSLFLRASLAYIAQHPLVVSGYIWDHFVGLTIGQPWRCLGDSSFPNCMAFQTVTFYPAYSSVTLAPGRMPDRAVQFLDSRQVTDQPLMTAAEHAWQWVYFNLRIVLLTAMSLGLIGSFLHKSRLRWTLVTFTAVYLINMAVYSVLGTPEYRFQIISVAMSAFVAGGCIFIFLSQAAKLFVRKPG